MLKHLKDLKLGLKSLFLFNFISIIHLIFEQNIFVWQISAVQHYTCWIYFDLYLNFVFSIMQNYPVRREWKKADWLDPLLMYWVWVSPQIQRSWGTLLLTLYSAWAWRGGEPNQNLLRNFFSLSLDIFQGKGQGPRGQSQIQTCWGA